VRGSSERDREREREKKGEKEQRRKESKRGKRAKSEWIKDIEVSSQTTAGPCNT